MIERGPEPQGPLALILRRTAGRGFIPTQLLSGACGRLAAAIGFMSPFKWPLANPLLAAPQRFASWFILLAVLLDMAGLGISITVLPALIGNLTGGASAGWVNGVFVGVWALVQFACAPLLGSLSDRFGRRPLLLISMLGLGLDYVVMAVAPNLWWLLLGRIVSGATASSFSICYAYVADQTPEANRAAAFGRLGAAFGLGFILGPAVGGLLGAVSLHLPFWAAAGFSAANFVFGVLVLPESLPQERRAPFSWRKANPLGSVALLRTHRELSGLAVVHFLSQFAGSSISGVYVLYVGRRYGWSMQTVGFSLAFVGLLVALVQGVGLGRVTALLGERRTLLLGLVGGTISLLAFGFASQGWVVWVALAAFGLWGLQGPSTSAIMSRRVSGTEQGALQGALASVTALADGIGPFAFGALFTLTAAGDARSFWTGASFLAGGLLLAGTLAFAFTLLRRPALHEPSGVIGMATDAHSGGTSTDALSEKTSEAI